MRKCMWLFCQWFYHMRRKDSRWVNYCIALAERKEQGKSCSKPVTVVYVQGTIQEEIIMHSWWEGDPYLEGLMSAWTDYFSSVKVTIPWGARSAALELKHWHLVISWYETVDVPFSETEVIFAVTKLIERKAAVPDSLQGEHLIYICTYRGI